MKMLTNVFSLIVLSVCFSAPASVEVDNVYGRGCCSYHGGVCGCSGGRAQCCDGTLSPSCGC